MVHTSQARYHNQDFYLFSIKKRDPWIPFPIRAYHLEQLLYLKDMIQNLCYWVGFYLLDWKPMFIKNLLNISAIIFLSVISFFCYLTSLGIYHYIFWIFLLQPSWHSKCSWYCFRTVLIYFEIKAFLTVFLTSQTNFCIFHVL